MDIVKFTGELRSDVGKKNSKTLRREGSVPAVIYGYKGENVHFSCKPIDVRGLIYTAQFKLAEIDVDGKSYKCILKDADFHPVSDELVHMDFLMLTDGHPIKYNVPVRPVGESPGVKIGGKLQQKLRTVRVKTTPDKMIDHLTVDISSLELGASVRVKDISAPEGFEIMNPMNNPVASVEVPRALRSAAAKAEAEAK